MKKKKTISISIRSPSRQSEERKIIFVTHLSAFFSWCVAFVVWWIVFSYSISEYIKIKYCIKYPFGRRENERRTRPKNFEVQNCMCCECECVYQLLDLYMVYVRACVWNSMFYILYAYYSLFFVCFGHTTQRDQEEISKLFVSWFSGTNYTSQKKNKQ